MLIYDLSIEADEYIKNLYCLYDNNENEIFEGGFTSYQSAQDRLEQYLKEWE
jgi:hypothetical protein